eukprot:281208-Amphidinium_carterae.1
MESHVVAPGQSAATTDTLLPALDVGPLSMVDDLADGLQPAHCTPPAVADGSLTSALSQPPSTAEPPSIERVFADGGAIKHADFVPVTLQEVLDSYTRVKPRRAAIDDVHPTIFVAARDVLSPIYVDLFNKALATGQVPLCWKASQLVPIPKKAIAASDPAAHRPVVLTSNEAKLFEGVLKARVEQFISWDQAQFGVGKAVGVDFVSFIFSQVTVGLRSAGRPYACLFIDVSGAFDNILRQIMWTSSSQVTIDQLMNIGVDEQIAQWLVQAVREQPCLLLRDTVPPSLVDAISAFYENS